MNVRIDYIRDYLLRATTPDGLTFYTEAHNETPSGPSPMMMLLASIPSCSAMDVLSILRKQRVEIDNFHVTAHATRAEEHPRVFTSLHLHYVLTTPNGTEQQMRRAIELSLTKYCSASAMVQRSGCTIEWTLEIHRPQER